MKSALFAITAIGVGIAVGFWLSPPFGKFSILAKPSAS